MAKFPSRTYPPWTHHPNPPNLVHKDDTLPLQLKTFLPACKIFKSGSTNRQISILYCDTSKKKVVYHQEILPNHSTTMQAEHLELNRALQLTSWSRRTAIYGACRSALSIAINNERLSQISKKNREIIIEFDLVQLIWYSQSNVSINMR